MNRRVPQKRVTSSPVKWPPAFKGLCPMELAAYGKGGWFGGGIWNQHESMKKDETDKLLSGGQISLQIQFESGGHIKCMNRCRLATRSFWNPYM
jgi:hypothetical protein